MNRQSTSRGARRLKGIVILHEDRDILVVDKPAGLLTIATDKERERTAYYLLMDYVRKGNAKSRNRIFIVHRLDRETSGALIFAKSEEAKTRLQDEWEATEKKYLAVVHGRLENRADTIESHLAEHGAHLVHSTADRSKGKLARTAYRVLKETKIYSLLELDLLTGRKHQIRVHLADIGHPVAGDKKYGKREDRQTRLALHAWSVCFDHPFNGERMTVVAKAPAFFNQLVGELDFSARPAR